jgi:hypothetical protein
VLDKSHLPAGPKDPPGFHESPSHINDAAERPSHDDGVNAFVIQREFVCRASKHRHLVSRACDRSFRQSRHLGRRVDTDDLVNCLTVEGAG